MIVIIKDKEAETPYTELLKSANLSCQVSDYRKMSDADLLSTGAEVFLLLHKMSVLHAQALQRAFSVEKGNRPFRILVVLKEPYAQTFVKARIAGADKCILEPIDNTLFLNAVNHCIEEARRCRQFIKLTESGTLFQDRYRLMRVIGVSMHSTVVLAHDRVTEREVTVKFLNGIQKTDTRQIEEFSRKVQQLEQVQSPTLATVCGYGNYDDVPYVIFNVGFVDNMYDLLQERALQETDLIEIGLSVIRALIAMKNNHILHLDVRPENILWFNNEIHLCDFGLVQPYDNVTDETGNPYWCNPGFASPEFFSEGGILTARSDVYSLGVVLYTLIQRENPHLGRPFDQMLSVHKHEPLRLQEPKMEISAILKSAVESMLLFREEARPRLRDLEIIFLQLLALAGQPSLLSSYLYMPDATPTGARLTDTGTGKITGTGRISQTGSYSTSTGKLSSKSTRMKLQETTTIRRGQIMRLDDEDPGSLTRVGRILHFCRNHIILTILAVPIVAALFFSGFLFARISGKSLYFKQGPKQMFTCYAGHSFPLRTLDFRTVRCPECHELTSLSYSCLSCGEIFGLSIWPARDMSEEESAEFEAKLKRCPFCESIRIKQTPLVEPASADSEAKKNLARKKAMMKQGKK